MLCVKTKELGPLGGDVPGAPPLDPPMHTAHEQNYINVTRKGNWSEMLPNYFLINFFYGYQGIKISIIVAEK